MNVEPMAVRLENVRQSKAHFELGPFDLEIPKGIITAIVGPNGSGKSSLFRLMLDLTKPDAGRIELLGETVGSGDDRLLKRGYVPEQADDMEDHLRGEQKAAFIRQWYPGWDSGRFRELLRLFEIDPSIRLGKMSKGMRRKFDLALAMAHHPELLLLDEPSSGLDPIAWKTMIGLLHRDMEGGERTVLMSSHIVEEVRRLADYIVFIVQGRVLGLFEKDELLESWYAIYAETDAAPDWTDMPGYCEAEPAGGTRFRLVTSEAARAEEWLASRGVRIAGRQKLELDEILLVLQERERLRIRS
ncbi:ABC transporter ATP-binding protein [Paenibacillus humicola]|uniref:ABC transporter ATP-binding protein n=1 Tax=Paenibacillus humicola TaxID=3110540 RepID=UPI00237B5D27|nr:ABC transporter ATP-binding protein [Paenibacillus humicola]